MIKYNHHKIYVYSHYSEMTDIHHHPEAVENIIIISLKSEFNTIC